MNNLPIGYLRGDIARAAHIEDKAKAIAELKWRPVGMRSSMAYAPNGIYRVSRVDSGSRVARYRYRFKAVFIPSDSDGEIEIALESKREWALLAAVNHFKRHL